MAHAALNNEIEYTFTDKEIDLICHAVISSVVPTSRGLQDKLYDMLKTHEKQ